MARIERSKQYAQWKNLNKKGLLFTPEKINEICDKCKNNPMKIGEYMLSIANSYKQNPIDFKESDDSLIFLESKNTD